MNKQIASDLINSGKCLGSIPKFDIGDKVIYQRASIDKTGYWGHDESLFQKRVFQIVDMRQIMVGFPVMNLIWSYKTTEINPRSHQFAGWSFLEPEILIFEESL